MGNEIKPTDMASEPEVVYRGNPKDRCHTGQQAVENPASCATKEVDIQMSHRRAMEKSAISREKVERDFITLEELDTHLTSLITDFYKNKK